MKQISDDQLDILHEIDKYIDKNGYSPSVRELCELTNRKSTSTIFYHLKRLKELGYIDYNEKQSRTIRIKKYPVWV